ncbi:MAG TPA: formyltransferase family protein, partial [Gammaproteobacteria bacterium]
MRIIVNGQQAFGKSVLEALLDRGEEVVGVYCEPDKEGRPVDPIKEAALERNLPLFQPKSYRKSETHEQIASLKPDLCVMAYVTLFVPEEALHIPTHG